MDRITELIIQLKEQRMEYFDEFYDLTKKLVYYTIVLIVKRSDVSEDLMQDTYVKFLANIDKCDIHKYPKAYLVMIARNLAINYFNRNKRIELDEEYISKLKDCEETKIDIGIIDYLEGVGHDVVTYHIVLDMKFKDIAKVVDKPLGTVLWLYRKSIDKLKKKVGE